MESEHFVGKIAQKAVIENDSKILICRHPQNGSLWELPGGRLHRNEELKDGLKREIMEELGVDADIHDMFYSEQGPQTNNGEAQVYLMYRATLANPDQVFAPDSSEVQDIAWVTQSELDTYEMYPTYMRALDAYFGRNT